LRYRAEQGRAVLATQLPIARRYCELEVLSTDRYALLAANPNSPRALNDYLACVRALVTVGQALGESSTAVLHTFEKATREAGAATAHRELLDLYGPKRLEAGK
jgi:hypothetical protein